MAQTIETKLSVNLNKVALLRNQRDVGYPSVLEAAVVAGEDANGLIKPYAFVVLKDGEPRNAAMEEALKQHIKTTLVPYKYPRWIEFVDELPKTSTGKIQRFILRQRLDKQEATVNAASTP